MAEQPNHRSQKTEVLSVETCASTNELALREGLRGRQPPFWVTAATQTAGKGRDGRKWHSAPGNLHATLLLAFPRQTQSSTQLAALTGVAVAETIEDAAQNAISARAGGAPDWVKPEIQLKWPNDVMLGQTTDAGKVAGILIETTTWPADGTFLVAIGIGINVRTNPGNLDQPTSSLADHGIDPPLEALLAQLDHAMLGWLARWQNGTSFDEVKNRWHERSGAIGRRVNLQHADKPIAGICQGLDDDGALLLIDAHGRLRRITYGDVTFSRSDADEVSQDANDLSRTD